ncbi:MAG: hypothetical protein ACMUHU_05545 [Thermoplasmatota archaeon]
MGGLRLDEVSQLREREKGFLIGICTVDFSFLHDIVKILKEKQIPRSILEPGSVFDASMDCLILEKGVDPPNFTFRMPNVVELTSNPREIVDRAIAACFGKDRPMHLVAGVDPGKRPGIAIIADGTLISASRSGGPSSVLDALMQARRSYRPREMLVRVGDGDPSQGSMIISDLKGAGFRIEIVDESQTTRTKKYRDENAAVLIARTPGEPV